jgi:hypothetical protein
MPQGSAWSPAYEGFLDRILDAVADNGEAVRKALEKLSYIRNPYLCPIELLPDLEREFGIGGNEGLAEKDRREALAAVRYKIASLATVAKLQRYLDKAGFGRGGYGLIVTNNGSPAVNPIQEPGVEYSHRLSAHEFPSVYAAGTAIAFAGMQAAFIGQGGVYYLVNRVQLTSRPLYPQAGQICARAFDGSDEQSGRECAGYYKVYHDVAQKYTATDNPLYWPFAFFVGGEVDRNPDGSIAYVHVVTVPASRREELHKLILRIKPLGTWAAMMISYQ